MSKLNSLLQRVSDPQLRVELTEAVAEIRSTKDFGLVFESHLPETVKLPHHPIRRGVKVLNRASEEDSIWEVVRINGEKATLVPIRPEGAETDSDQPSEIETDVDSLVVVAEFGDTIYPGLKKVGEVKRGGNKPSHIVINAENHHALEALQFTHPGKVDCIYIDPPYNSGARDWKYNNDYVDGEDAYRHSKWLAFIQRRLLLAKKLLHPDDSVLIVTIDEKEVHRLALLVEQVFAGCPVQMVSIVTNPKGTGRSNEFSRVDEYALFVRIGAASIDGWPAESKGKEVRWRYLRRTDDASARGTVKGGPSQFYPVYVNKDTGRIVEIGTALTPDQDLSDVPAVAGAVPVFPIREDDGKHMNWGLTAPSLQEALDNGFVRVTLGKEAQPYTVAYLTSPNRKRIDTGEYKVTGVRADGSKVVVMPDGKRRRPTTAWKEKAHEAGVYGTSLLGELLPGRPFPFPKSLHAVEDCLRLVVGDRPSATILDFFVGSGTTTHAVARLNRQDGGRRRSIAVTNNEVSDVEAKRLMEDGRRPGDPEWNALGIFEHVTRPRIEAAITGVTHEGKRVNGDYKFTDEFAMAEGFQENIEFFELTYQDPSQIELDRAFNAIAPLLWMRSGGQGEIIEESVDSANRRRPYAWTDRYGVLFNPDRWQSFVSLLPGSVATVFIVTDSPTVFSNVVAELPPHVVDSVRLYERYLTTFAINGHPEGTV